MMHLRKRSEKKGKPLQKLLQNQIRHLHLWNVK